MITTSRPLLRRLIHIDHAVRAGRYPNANSVARELEVSPRTVHRDFEFLRDTYGAPLTYSPEHNGYYYTSPDYALPALRLTEGELVALFLTERLLEAHRHGPFARDLATIVQKLAAALPDEITVDLSHLSEAFSIRAPPASAVDVRRFKQLSRAVQSGRQLELTYWTASRDETLKRVVDPYHLTSVDGEWYLVGHCHLREDVRLFALGRIRAMRETGQRCQRPPDFTIAGYLDSAFRAFRGSGPPQRVRLCFLPNVARYIRERMWHSSQQIEEQPDGSLVLSLRLSHLIEVKRWALSWGADCIVLEPDELRLTIAQEAREIMAKLSQSSSTTQTGKGNHA